MRSCCGAMAIRRVCRASGCTDTTRSKKPPSERSAIMPVTPLADRASQSELEMKRSAVMNSLARDLKQRSRCCVALRKDGVLRVGDGLIMARDIRHVDAMALNGELGRFGVLQLRQAVAGAQLAD